MCVYYSRLLQTLYYEYVESGFGLEQIKSIEAPNGNKIKYHYDYQDRVWKTEESIEGQNYNHYFDYDNFGKLKTETYPGGFKLIYNYNDNGELISVQRDDNGETIWHCNDYNAQWQPETIFLGNQGCDLETKYTYDAFNRISGIITGNQFSMHYQWQPETGNLVSRTDNIHGLTETFQYDDADRLTDWQVNGLPGYSIEYATNGNIDLKSDAGDYVYHDTKVHAVENVMNYQVKFRKAITGLNSSMALKMPEK